MYIQKTKIREEMTGNAGFSLIELMIAIAVFSIGILAVASLQVSAIAGNSKGRKISDELVIAESQLEFLMAQPYATSPVLNPDNAPYQAVAGAYTMVWNVTNFDLNGDGTIDSIDDLDGDGIPDARQIDLTVTHTGNANRTTTLQHIIPQL
jgi:prepilin-type N-terminal cleavage/methylation domain-containing protein